jgi:predicted Fe-Mo cluster-binding NifX family protein
MSGKRKTSLVLADVDGTLVTSAGRARDAVNALQRAGIDVVLVMTVNPSALRAGGIRSAKSMGERTW